MEYHLSKDIIRDMSRHNMDTFAKFRQLNRYFHSTLESIKEEVYLQYGNQLRAKLYESTFIPAGNIKAVYPNIKHGDALRLRSHDPLNRYTYLYDSDHNRFVELDRSITQHGSIPDVFRVSEVRFTPMYWLDIIPSSIFYVDKETATRAYSTIHMNEDYMYVGEVTLGNVKYPFVLNEVLVSSHDGYDRYQPIKPPLDEFINMVWYTQCEDETCGNVYLSVI